MIKRICIIITMLLAILLTACSLSSIPDLPEIISAEDDSEIQIQNSSSEDMQTTENQETDIETSQSSPVALNDEADRGNIFVKIMDKDPIIELAPDGSGEIILSYTCELPVFTSENNDYALGSINEFFTQLNEQYYTGTPYTCIDLPWSSYNSLLEQSYSNFQTIIDYNLSDTRSDFIFTHKLEPVRVDSKVISVKIHDYLYNGGDKEKTCVFGISFDPISGKIISKDDFSVYTDPIIDYINDIYKLELNPSEVFIDGKWYISDTGFSFIIDIQNSGELSDYIVAEVPFNAVAFSDATYITNERFFSLNNNIQIFSENETGFPVVDLAVSENVDNHYFISFQGTAYDVTVSSVQYSDFDSVFYVKSVYWKANYIKNSCIQLNVDLPEGMPRILISYFSDNEIHSFYLSYDGVQGFPVFIENVSPIG